MATRLFQFTVPELQRDSLEGLMKKATTIHCTIGLQWWEKNCPHNFAANAFPTSAMHSPIAQPLQAHKASTQHGFQNSMFLQSTFIRGGESRLALLIFTTFTAQLLVIGQFHSDQVSTFVIFPKPLQTVASGRRIWLQLVGWFCSYNWLVKELGLEHQNSYKYPI